MRSVCLVRRLLENGANSSFVHQMAYASVALGELAKFGISVRKIVLSHDRPRCDTSPDAVEFPIRYPLSISKEKRP